MKKLDRDLHYDEALRLFKKKKIATKVAKDLCDKYGLEYNESEGRKVRKWLNPALLADKGQIIGEDDQVKNAKILIYDIETSRAVFKRFWTGEQYVSYKDMTREPAIITIAWKWLDEDTVYSDTWDMKTHSDKKLIKNFLKVYNEADMVVGINNNSFDNKWVAARAAKYGFPINTYIKSFDVQRKARKLFMLPSYSMDYLTKWLNVTNKQSHEGIKMWDMIEDGSKAEQEEYIEKMLVYNKYDVICTQDLYMKLRTYMNSPLHVGVLKGSDKYTCPECGGSNIELYKNTVTSAGSVQRVMICKDDGIKFKINDTEYRRFLASEVSATEKEVVNE